jgi:cell division protein FtsQ
VLAVSVAMALGAGWWVSNSPVFDLRNLEVLGTTHLTANQIGRLSGVTEHTNVLWTFPGAVERRIEANPWVLKATVARHLPSGLTIEVTERVPAAVTVGTPPMLIAADGVVLGRASPDTELPSIVPPPGTLAVGDRLTISTELAVVGALPESLRHKVTTVTRQPDGSLALIMRNGPTVYYGDGSEVEAKAEALRAVLGWAARNHVHPAYVDLRAPAAPSVGTVPLRGPVAGPPSPTKP